MNKIVIIQLFLLFFIIFNIKFVLAEDELDQYRQLRCTTPDGLTKAGPNMAKCRLILKDKENGKGREAPTDDLGCFSSNEKPKEEINNKKKTKTKLNNNQKQQKRIFCNLACPNASVWFHSPIEQGHQACFKGFGYGLEEKDNEWYIWRADKCLNSTATFTVGCKWKGKRAIERFNILMKQKFPNDKALFEKLANGYLQK